ncbi:alpha/beta hydrolase [Fulvivirga lutea]|uniref:Phospholipase/carboxylesterase/thioesterase domain-containing protein n=1 Tax=Fulvivirga lutea TaxID=2810512 RepID=A0A974WK70_9BACT|nr:hypothetical protein [Fulvivirga lutea]QSE97670.1 hypothetical protein JR347_00870 [Fulvivirga lutea]
MQEHHFNFSYKGRYSQLGELNTKTKHVLFVLHGYGQLSKFFIRKFSCLEDHGFCIIAPEGLSKFYLEGFSGRVGATWMTKENREVDIENYIEYLNQLYTNIKKDISTGVKITLLGFSQGSATVSRWIASGQIEFNQLILWAGIFPPDMDITVTREILTSKEIKYVYGLDDPFIKKERLQEMSEISSHLKLNPETITFNGKHDIDTDTLLQIFVNNS